IGRAGMLNSLAQTLLKAASPGVPDFYQGSDLWDFNLVDPDNRRPVDFAARERALDDVDRMLALPRFRRAQPEVFLEGDYLPLATETTVPGRVVSFARLLAGSQAVIVVAP